MEILLDKIEDEEDRTELKKYLLNKDFESKTLLYFEGNMEALLYKTENKNTIKELKKYLVYRYFQFQILPNGIDLDKSDFSPKIKNLLYLFVEHIDFTKVDFLQKEIKKHIEDGYLKEELENLMELNLKDLIESSIDPNYDKNKIIIKELLNLIFSGNISFKKYLSNGEALTSSKLKDKEVEILSKYITKDNFIEEYLNNKKEFIEKQKDLDETRDRSIIEY